MRDEQQARARQRLAQPRVVDAAITVLPVPVAETSRFRWWPALAGQRDLLEQPLLERLRPELDRAQR